jgi:hypothetical protein
MSARRESRRRLSRSEPRRIGAYQESDRRIPVPVETLTGDLPPDQILRSVLWDREDEPPRQRPTCMSQDRDTGGWARNGQLHVPRFGEGTLLHVCIAVRWVRDPDLVVELAPVGTTRTTHRSRGEHGPWEGCRQHLRLRRSTVGTTRRDRNKERSRKPGPHARSVASGRSWGKALE